MIHFKNDTVLLVIIFLQPLSRLRTASKQEKIIANSTLLQSYRFYFELTIFHVKHHVEEQLSELGIDVNFNSCLLNYYPSGDDGMGYHADDERELGAQPIIASLSLGATRKFVFKHKTIRQKNKPVKVELYLESGQLIVMHGDTQRFWKHSITKTKTVATGRISLTFRQIHPNS